MDKLTADDLVQGSDPEQFATNTLEIAVPPDNPADVRPSRTWPTPTSTWSSARPEVPCGAAAQSVAEAAGVTLQPDSEEQSVTDVLGKVTSGEADAGLVYVTDVITAGDAVQGIEFPESGVGGEQLPDRHGGRQRERRPGPGVRRPRAQATRASRSSPTPASASP